MGYLTHFYVEHIYGEEDAKFRSAPSIFLNALEYVPFNSIELVNVRTLLYVVPHFSEQCNAMRCNAMRCDVTRLNSIRLKAIVIIIHLNDAFVEFIYAVRSNCVAVCSIT